MKTLLRKCLSEMQELTGCATLPSTDQSLSWHTYEHREVLTSSTQRPLSMQLLKSISAMAELMICGQGNNSAQFHHWPSTAQDSNSERNGLQFRGKVGLA